MVLATNLSYLSQKCKEHFVIAVRTNVMFFFSSKTLEKMSKNNYENEKLQ